MGASNQIAGRERLAGEVSEMGITMEEFNKYKSDFLEHGRHLLTFKPREGNVIDKKINLILKLLKIDDIPLFHMRD